MRANQSIQVECNETLQNKYLEHTVINDIICKYLDNKSSKNSDDLHLYRNKGEHALLKSNDEYLNSIRNFSSVYCNAEDPVPIAKNNYKQTSYIQSYPCKKKYTYNVNVNHLQSVTDIKLTSNEKMYVDKTTFCRPVLNLYNEQFIFKTMERNARLKKLVKKLAMARQREKENVTWNNFINELKNKHGTNNSNYSCTIYDDVRENITPEIINDFYNTKFSFNKQSRLCENLLEDFYNSYNTSQPNSTYCRQLNDSKKIQPSTNYKFDKYGENLFCYPTSSLGRLIMMDKEQRRRQHLNNWGKHVSDRNVHVGGDREGYLNKKKFKFKTNFKRTSAVQTDFKPIPDFIQNVYKDKATNNTSELDKTNWSVKQEPDKVLKQNSLENIENKLETLIVSINTFIDEIKVNKKLMKDNSLRCEISNSKSKELNTKINNPVIPTKAEKAVSRVDTDSCGTVVNMSAHNPSTLCTVAKLSDIFPNIGTATKRISNSYQVYVEEPTRDCSTEVTKSFSKHNDVYKNNMIEEMNTLNQKQFPYQRNMTIAVNTDPLSILALLRVSTDTLKSIMSYIPNLNYYSYLSLLQTYHLSVPHSIKTAESHYVCNICGADFSKPSELSDHILEHNLGKTRDCCVCRHVLDRVRRQSLFRCKYCGQCFTRAYCCELHQNSCAKQMGRNDDVSSELLLLR